MRYVMAAMLAALVAGPVLAATPLSDAQMDEVAAGGFLSGFAGVVTVSNAGTGSSSSTVTVSE